MASGHLLALDDLGQGVNNVFGFFQAKAGFLAKHYDGGDFVTRSQQVQQLGDVVGRKPHMMLVQDGEHVRGYLHGFFLAARWLYSCFSRTSMAF